MINSKDVEQNGFSLVVGIFLSSAKIFKYFIVLKALS